MSRQLACSKIADEIRLTPDVYVLVVSKSCTFCQQVLDNVQSYGFKHPLIVADSEACSKQLDGVLKYDMYPVIVHFKDGRESRRAVGVEDIAAFDRPAAATASEEEH